VRAQAPERRTYNETPGVLVGRDNVVAGTDCGFAQGPFVQRVHPSIMWARLRALVEGARLASKALWPRRAAA
jgi:5-methyltetrahydropteroyltriglutamate--homocysteine methyltransferase